LISCWSEGLLYGHEVPRPQGFREEAQRKRAFRPHLNRPAPRRQQVLARLLEGWSVRQIAAEMRTGICAVNNHITALCRQEIVPDRHALARKIGCERALPLNRPERTRERRKRVMKLLLAGLTYEQMALRLQTKKCVINRDVIELYRAHGVSGRDALRRKLGNEGRSQAEVRAAA
jgi:DNA-binding NarL/FixJ family response regulator